MRRDFFYLVIIFLFFACSKDDESERKIFNEEDFIGGWAYTSLEVDGEIYTYPHQENCNKDFIIFRNNEGQWHQFTETIFVNEACANQGTNMEWEIKEKTLNLYFGEQLVISYNILQISQNSLSLLTMIDLNEGNGKEEVIINFLPYDPYGEFED